MMYQILVREPLFECLNIAVLLPGRGQPAVDLLARYDRYSGLNNTRLVAVEPIDEFYPAPKGADDQEEAVWGLKVSVPELNDFIADLEEEYEIERANIALVGFSAGAVMAIQAAAYSDRPYGAVIAHNGAILDPDDLPPAKHATPFLVIHNENDDCFSWDERYLPMKKALVDQGYALKLVENEVGGHCISADDVREASDWLRGVFNC